MAKDNQWGSGGRPGQPGSMEYTRPDLYPNYSPESSQQQTKIVSPSFNFSAPVTTVVAFNRMMRIMERAGFETVNSYRGPDIGIKVSEENPVKAVKFAEAMEKHPDIKVPFSGIRLVMPYDNDEDTYAKLKFSGGKKAKIGIKVKGTMQMTHWKEIERRIRKKFGKH
jgi:hypothetical protein